MEVSGFNMRKGGSGERSLAVRDSVSGWESGSVNQGDRATERGEAAGSSSARKGK